MSKNQDGFEPGQAVELADIVKADRLRREREKRPKPARKAKTDQPDTSEE